jgi:F0F1-type ATP synthase assembly protein I
MKHEKQVINAILLVYFFSGMMVGLAMGVLL